MICKSLFWMMMSICQFNLPAVLFTYRTSLKFLTKLFRCKNWWDVPDVVFLPHFFFWMAVWGVVVWLQIFGVLRLIAFIGDGILEKVFS